MFLCTDLFISTQHWANEGPNPPLTIVALMTQHYPADPEINFSIFDYPAHALHTLWQQAAGEARGSFSSIWCLVSFRSCLIEVKWLVMCCAMYELLILRITEKTGSEENMIVFATMDLFSNHKQLNAMIHRSDRSAVISLRVLTPSISSWDRCTIWPRGLGLSTVMLDKGCSFYTVFRTVLWCHLSRMRSEFGYSEGWSWIRAK